MKTIDEIKHDVAFELGFINYFQLEKDYTSGKISFAEFNKFIEVVAKNYSREAERFYNGE